MKVFEIFTLEAPFGKNYRVNFSYNDPKGGIASGNIVIKSVHNGDQAKDLALKQLSKKKYDGLKIKSATPVKKLDESRQQGVTYTEKKAKGMIDKVTATLSGTQSASMTKLAKRYARLEASLKAMKEKHDELNTRLKNEVQDLFEAEDVIYTRVVETAQFTLTMAKEIQKEPEQKTEIDYEKIIAALSMLIPDELQSKVDQVVAKYTTVLEVPAKPPVKRLSVSKEVGAPPVVEGLLDNLKKKFASFVESIRSWGERYDKKLDRLKKQAGIQ